MEFTAMPRLRLCTCASQFTICVCARTSPEKTNARSTSPRHETKRPRVGYDWHGGHIIPDGSLLVRAPGGALVERVLSRIPVDFSRKLLRGEQPDLLLEADATDPMAIGYAVGAMNSLTPIVLNRDLTGPLAKLRASSAPFNLVLHQHYNPENITQYNIVPGLMGVILTMTMNNKIE